MGRKSLAELADDGVRWTGIPAMVERRERNWPLRRRPLRWWPLLGLALALGGLALVVAHPARSWLGTLLIYLALAIGCIVRAHGPLAPLWGPDRQDERERALFYRAYATAGFAAGVIGPMALVGLAGWATANDWSRDALARVLVAAGFAAVTIWATLPTLHASWLIRPLADED